MLEWPGKIVKVYKIYDRHRHPSLYHDHKIRPALAMSVNFQL